MLSAHWILVVGILFNDGHNLPWEETLYKKQYCMDQARVRWRDFYSSGLSKEATMSTLCKNYYEPQEFFKIYCNENGVCIPNI